MSSLKTSIGFMQRKSLSDHYTRILTLFFFYLLVLTVFLQCAYVNCIIRNIFYFKSKYFSFSLFISIFHIQFSSKLMCLIFLNLSISCFVGSLFGNHEKGCS